jgi:hypothetical protein
MEGGKVEDIVILLRKAGYNHDRPLGKDVREWTLE